MLFMYNTSSDQFENATSPERQVQEMTRELASAARLNACHCKHLADARADVSRLESERNRLAADLEQVRAYADKILHELQGVTTDLRAESDAVHKLRSDSLQLEKACAAVTDENARLQARVQALAAQLEERGGALEPGHKGPLQMRIDELTAEAQQIPGLRAEVAALRRAVLELEEEGRRLREGQAEARTVAAALHAMTTENEQLRTGEGALNLVVDGIVLSKHSDSARSITS